MRKYYLDSMMMLDEPNVSAAYTDAFYLVSDADARFAEMRKAFETSSTDEENRLRAALREIAGYEGPDEALDINAANMRSCAREALGLPTS